MATLAWIGRVFGFLIILGGFFLLFKPLAMFEKTMEYLGNLFTLGGRALTFILSVMLSLLVIGAGWGLTHLGVGTAVLILVVVVVAWGIRMARRMPALYKKWEDAITNEEMNPAEKQ